MKLKFGLKFFVGAASALVLTAALASDASAQGRGRGNSGGGGGSTAGRGNGNGNSGGGVVMGGGSTRDDGWGNTSRRPETSGRGNSDSKGRGETKSGDRRYTGLSKQTGIPADQLRLQYDAARRANPDLTYGQFVAANMIAKNHDGISSGDILAGLRSGRSIGQTLKDSGWNDSQIKKERKRIKDANKKEDAYKDRDDDWD